MSGWHATFGRQVGGRRPPGLGRRAPGGATPLAGGLRHCAAAIGGTAC